MFLPKLTILIFILAAFCQIGCQNSRSGSILSPEPSPRPTARPLPTPDDCALVELGPLPALEITIEDPQGRPIGDAEVRVNGWLIDFPTHREGPYCEAGFCEWWDFSDPVEMEYVVEVTLAGFETVEDRVIIPATGPTCDTYWPAHVEKMTVVMRPE